MTSKAVASLIEKKDTLFIHSDTIRANFDTNRQVKTIFCYHKSKFFRTDIQGMSDSLTWHSSDSSMTMYIHPVIWSGKNQLTADTITLTMRNNQVDSMFMRNSAFIISRDDSGKFNQVKGREMTGFFINNDLYKIKVTGNAETVYFAREDDRTLIGINKAESSNMLIFLEKNEVKSITYIGQPTAVLYPEKQISPYDLFLRDFVWIEEKRPLSKEDIFVW